jgi:HlyD family secretion protein
LETMNSYGTLKAPFDGVVVQRHIDLGDLVRTTETASRLPLFTVAQTNIVRVSVMVPEKDAAKVSEGAAVNLRVQSLPGRTFEGKVSRFAGSLDESTRTMLVEMDLPNEDGELLPGMFGEATIVLEERKDAIVLPAKVVRHDEQGHSYVYVVTAENLLKKTAVTVGLDNGTDLEIVCPLEGDERIVDATLTTIKDGQRVQVAQ